MVIWYPFFVGYAHVFKPHPCFVASFREQIKAAVTGIIELE